MAKLSVEQALAKAKSHIKKGDLAEAQTLYATILQVFPNNKKAQKGLTALGGGRRSAAEQRPPQAVIDQLMGLYRQGQLELVVDQTQDLTVQFPKAITLWNILGASAAELGKLDQAVKAFEEIISLNPNQASAYYNLGNALKDQGKMEEAIGAYNKALVIKPDYEAALNNVVIALKTQDESDEKRIKKALETYNKAQALKTENSNSYFSRALALQDQGKLEEAIVSYNKALTIKPDYADAYNNMGNALKDQGKLEEAIEAYNKALAIRPEYAEAYFYMGIALQERGKLEEAIAAYNKALAIRPEYAGAYNNMGIALKEQGKLEEAIAAYNKALAIKPDYEPARAAKLHGQAHICDWDNIATDIKLIPKLGTFETHVPPFLLLSLEDAPERHRLRSEIYSKARYPQKNLPLPAKPLTKPKRIRIGYFSTDFKEHPVAYLIAKVLEQHNRDQFEVFGYSLHGSSAGEMRQRLEKSFDSFTDVQSMSDRDIALQAQQDGIDIAVDLTGYTANSRSGILAFRAAPVQVNYLGYPGSMGAEFIDYIVADQHLIPPENQKHFSEKQIYLPDVYLPTDNTLPFSNEPSSRFDLGLPDSGFVFCAINNSYKVNERVFDIWMRLLKSVDGSVLWLLETNEIMKANLEKEASKRGVTSDRLVFAKMVSHEKYLSQFHQADLFLDTFPYTAGATASNVLWAGLPIITKNGQSYTARMAGSMLNAIGLPELITQTEKDYEALILDLATNLEKLTKIKEKLDANRLTHPLFNTELYTKHLENGYQQAYQNYFEGNLPKTITVPPLNAPPPTSTYTSRRITQAAPPPAS
ncbi:tetratricopeptide repeat protein, partial [bacterium]|nr:tetratricopeptide repeat protein [bacterium]